MKKKPKNKLHLKNLDVCLWLLDPCCNRATGRSHTLMMAYINLALKYPGEWFTVRDHYPTFQADEMLIHRIKTWFRSNAKDVPLEFKGHNNFRVSP